MATLRLVTGILFCLLTIPAFAARYDINNQTYISCISENTSSQAQFAEYEGDAKSSRIRSWFSRWLFGENKNTLKSQIDFAWRPKTDKGPQIKIITTEKPHNLIAIRSKTKESLIVVSSASSPMTTESWTFSLNFNLESMIATRVQSNMSGVRGEVLSYQCQFEDVTPTIDSNQDPAPIG
ncbi:MAG: hypothetical protein ACR2QW_06370 [bacterium]